MLAGGASIGYNAWSVLLARLPTLFPPGNLPAPALLPFSTALLLQPPNRKAQDDDALA